MSAGTPIGRALMRRVLVRALHWALIVAEECRRDDRPQGGGKWRTHGYETRVLIPQLSDFGEAP